MVQVCYRHFVLLILLLLLLLLPKLIHESFSFGLFSLVAQFTFYLTLW
jgi:hypothetical protein